MDAEASAHPELNKYQYEVENSYPKGPEYLDSDSSLMPEGTEHHEVLGTGARDEENTKKKSDYDTTIYLDVANIHKIYNDTRRTFTRKFMKVTFSRLNDPPENLSIYLKSTQMIHKTFQLISGIILKIALEESSYVRVARIRSKIMVQKKDTGK